MVAPRWHLAALAAATCVNESMVRDSVCWMLIDEKDAEELPNTAGRLTTSTPVNAMPPFCGVPKSTYVKKTHLGREPDDSA